AARNAVGIQERAAVLATALGEARGFKTMFFEQPSAFTKRLLEEELPYRSLPGYEPERWEPAVREARRLLKRTPYVDLGRALDSAQTPVLADFVHTNEEGARLAAQALYRHLKPKLELLDATRGGSR